MSIAHEKDPAGVLRITAPNPSPLTLEGTNTYLVARWVVDPGPDHAGHRDAILAATGESIEGIVLTHAHPDHAEGAEALALAAGGVPILSGPKLTAAGPLAVVPSPGHSPDHVCLTFGGTCFAGDLVMGRGSVFIHPDEGSMAAYLDSLRRIAALEPEVLCPGHGPYVRDPATKLAEYLEHRLAREEALVEALGGGARTADELLDAAWPEVGPELRAVAALTLQSHLAKLAEEGRWRPEPGLWP